MFSLLFFAEHKSRDRKAAGLTISSTKKKRENPSLYLSNKLKWLSVCPKQKKREGRKEKATISAWV